MKTVFVGVLLSLFLSQSGLAQCLSLGELIALRGKDVDGVNTYLSAKGWRFDDASEETDDKMSTSVWAHTKQSYSGGAKAFFRLIAADGYYNQVSYSMISKPCYDLIRSKIFAYKMVKVSSEAKSGYLSTTYLGENYRVEVQISTEEGNTLPTYTILLKKLTKAAVISPSNYDYGLPDASQEGSNSAETNDATSALDNTTNPQGNIYASRVDGKNYSPPPSGKYLCAWHSKSNCSLFESPDASSATLRNISVGDNVLVVDKLLDESHQYYLVWTEGQFGYMAYIELEEYGK